MELHEAILHLKKYQGYIPFNDEHGMMKHAFDLTDETVDTILAALSSAENAQAQTAHQISNQFFLLIEYRLLHSAGTRPLEHDVTRAEPLQRQRLKVKTDQRVFHLSLFQCICVTTDARQVAGIAEQNRAAAFVERVVLQAPT